MEYCEGGSVHDLMKMCNQQLTEDQIAVVCAHMIKGLVYLHSHHIVHRDLKVTVIHFLHWQGGKCIVDQRRKSKISRFWCLCQIVQDH